MDPLACWKRFLEHAEDQEIGEAKEALADLHDWLFNGGFQPNGVPSLRAVGTMLEVFAEYAGELA